jgi:Flp pilus assembly pilin Flp
MYLHRRLASRAIAQDGERGQGLAEYALILGLVAIVAIASLVFLGGTLSALFFDPISEEFGNVLDLILG